MSSNTKLTLLTYLLFNKIKQKKYIQVKGAGT